MEKIGVSSFFMETTHCPPQWFLHHPYHFPTPFPTPGQPHAQQSFDLGLLASGSA